jgi:hypothetical protein
VIHQAHTLALVCQIVSGGDAYGLNSSWFSSVSLGKLKPYISIRIVTGNALEPGSSFIVLFGVYLC